MKTSFLIKMLAVALLVGGAVLVAIRQGDETRNEALKYRDSWTVGNTAAQSKHTKDR